MIQESSPAQSPTYLKIPGQTGLYRHTVTGRYYGVKKVRGRRKERSLGTTDPGIAKRRLKEWVGNLEKVDSEVEKTTVGQLHRKYLAVMQGKSESTLATVKGIIECFERWWPHGLDFQVRNVRPSHLEEWLALNERRLKNTSYNRYAGVLKQVYELAVKDKIIAESPFLKVSTRWKRPQTPVRRIPTVEQFEAIVHSIRTQRYTRHREHTADFVEFLGLAGLGQAEASSLRWGDVDLARGSMTIRRHKTDMRFTVPIYPHLLPLMKRLQAKAGGKPAAGTRVLRISDAKKALTAACIRLSLPPFSQRSLRQCLIMRLWKAGLDKKLIAKWQGHQDGGQLILDTYTQVFGDDEADYEHMQLAKLEPSKPSDATAVQV